MSGNVDVGIRKETVQQPDEVGIEHAATVIGAVSNIERHVFLVHVQSDFGAPFAVDKDYLTVIDIVYDVRLTHGILAADRFKFRNDVHGLDIQQVLRVGALQLVFLGSLNVFLESLAAVRRDQRVEESLNGFLGRIIELQAIGGAGKASLDTVCLGLVRKRHIYPAALYRRHLEPDPILVTVLSLGESHLNLKAFLVAVDAFIGYLEFQRITETPGPNFKEDRHIELCFRHHIGDRLLDNGDHLVVDEVRRRAEVELLFIVNPHLKRRVKPIRNRNICHKYLFLYS